MRFREINAKCGQVVEVAQRLLEALPAQVMPVLQKERVHGIRLLEEHVRQAVDVPSARLATELDARPARGDNHVKRVGVRHGLFDPPLLQFAVSLMLRHAAWLSAVRRGWETRAGLMRSDDRILIFFSLYAIRDAGFPRLNLEIPGKKRKQKIFQLALRDARSDKTSVSGETAFETNARARKTKERPRKSKASAKPRTELPRLSPAGVRRSRVARSRATAPRGSVRCALSRDANGSCSTRSRCIL